jgi:hypothetical protein
MEGQQGVRYGFTTGLLAHISAEEKASLVAAAEAFPDPSPGQVEAARRRLDSLAPGPSFGVMAPVALVGGLLPGAMLGLLLAPMLQGAPLLTLFGVAVQRWDGERVTRGRALLRAAVVWGPLVVGSYWLAATALPLVVVVLVSSALALLWPERTLADRLAGTRLVPR